MQPYHDSEGIGDKLRKRKTPHRYAGRNTDDQNFHKNLSEFAERNGNADTHTGFFHQIQTKAQTDQLAYNTADRHTAYTG